MLPELKASFPLLRQSITFSKILFFHLLLLNGITQTPILGTLGLFQSFRKKYLISYDLPQILFLFLIARLRLGLSHLREHKFKHSFQDTLNSLCNCKSTTHFSLTVPSFLMKDALSSALYVALIVNCWILPIMISHKRYFCSSNNFKIINASIDYILSSKRFDEPLFKMNSFISSTVNPNLINNFLFYNVNFLIYIDIYYCYQLFYTSRYFPVYWYLAIV